MDAITLALTALATLIRNPITGGGSIRAEENVRLLQHLIQLIQGGRKTAEALKEFAERIEAMAAAGHNPSPRDFTEFEDRLTAAMTVVAEAKARVRSREPAPPSDDLNPPMDQ
jgi:hypothetical protein